ncbi:MAG: hypothetical protein JO348_00675 [Alphaproteobacteria bacterium]|nr:hypothetical protein [Alphaproteobacteria bacterium]
MRLLGLGGMALALALAGCGAPAPPTDKEMTAAFTAKRAKFDALQTELCKLHYDLTINVDPAWSSPQIPVADEKRLRVLLSELGVTNVKYLDTCQIWFTVWQSGVGTDAAYKKYRYGPPMYRVNEIKKPETDADPPERDLNVFIGNRARIASFEKKLDPNADWWIELDHWQ